MLAIHDGTAEREGWPAMRAFVYADEDAAQSAQRRARVQDETRLNRALEDPDNRGPQLLAGYGASVWRRNVALVQASSVGDVAAFPTEPDCAPDPVITSSNPLPAMPAPTTLVAPQVVALLDEVARAR